MGSNTSSREVADVRRVLDGIRRIVQGLRESSSHAERRTGLSGAQLFVLRRLSEAGGASINELAARTFTHQSSVSAVASKLVASGLAERRVDPADRRKRILMLTPKGRRALTTAPPSAQERLVQAVLTLPTGARRTVADALARMADTMIVQRRPAMFFEEQARA